MDNTSAAPTATELRKLAYLGDAVYECWVREFYLAQTLSLDELHKAVTQWTSAKGQQEVLSQLSPSWSEAWQELVRRARNMPLPSGTKRGGGASYRSATALESLVGYLSQASQRVEDCAALKHQITAILADNNNKSDSIN
jgi:23S rRNA maturation mini-RNase III